MADEWSQYAVKETPKDEWSQYAVSDNKPVYNHADTYTVTGSDPRGQETSLPKERTPTAVEDILSAPMNALHSGMQEGGKLIKEGSSKLGSVNPSENLEGFTQVLTGVAKGALGAGQIIPAMAAFTAGTTAAQKATDLVPDEANTVMEGIGITTPKKSIEVATSPVRTTLNTVIEETERKDPKLQNSPIIKFLKDSKGVQAGAELLDIGVPIFAGMALSKGKPELAQAVKEGKPIEGKLADDAEEVLTTGTEQDVQQAAKQIIVDSTHPDAQHLKEKEIDLHSDYNKIKNEVGEDVAAPLLPEIQKAEQDFQQQTVNLGEKEKVEKAQSLATSQTAKDLLGERLKEIQDNIDRYKPTKTEPDAIQEQGAGEILQRQQEETPSAGSERIGVESGEQGQEVAEPSKEKEVTNEQKDVISKRILDELKPKNLEPKDLIKEFNKRFDAEIAELKNPKPETPQAIEEQPTNNKQDESKKEGSKANAKGQNEKVTETPEPVAEKVAGEGAKEEAHKIAADHNYDHPSQMLNSIAKPENGGIKFETVQDAVKSDSPKVKEFLEGKKEANVEPIKTKVNVKKESKSIKPKYEKLSHEEKAALKAGDAVLLEGGNGKVRPEKITEVKTDAGGYRRLKVEGSDISHDINKTRKSTEEKPSLSKIKSKVIEKSIESKKSAKKEGVSLKVQKEDLLGQIDKARESVKNILADGTTEDAIEAKLKSAGFETAISEKVFSKYGNQKGGEAQVVFDVEGDGTFKLNAKGLDTAYEEVRKHWKVSEDKASKTRPSILGRKLEKGAVYVADTLEEQKQILADQKENLETAKKSGDDNLIKHYVEAIEDAEIKVKEFKKFAAKDQIAKGVEGVFNKLGANKNLLPEEKTKLFDDLKDIITGAVKLGHITFKEAAAHTLDLVKNSEWYKSMSEVDRKGAEEVAEGLRKEFEKEELKETKTTGVSNASQEARAKEIGIEPAKRGEGITPEEAVKKGQQKIREGADAEKIAQEYRETKKVSTDDINVLFTHADELAKETNKTAEEFGADSKEYKNALAKENKWNEEIVNPIKNEFFHQTGMRLQGDVEVDTGTFAGLQRAFQRENKKDFTPRQAEQAKVLSEKVKTLTKERDELQKKLAEKIDAAVKEDSKSPRKIKEKAKQLADTIRKGKLLRPDVFSAASPASIVWDGAIEVAARTVEAGGTIVQAAADGLAHIKNSDWYKDSDKKDEAEKAFSNFVKEKEGGDIHTRFVDKKDSKFTSEEIKDIWDYAKKEYLDKGKTYDEMIGGVSADLGLTANQVRRAISQPKGAKVITDEMYRTQYKRNQAVGKAKVWIKTADTPKLEKFLKAIPAFFFEKAIFGHGTVGMITHSGANIFNPITWKSYWNNFGRQFKYLANVAEYEKAKEDLQNKPNYIVAKRAGLANDPTSVYDDYAGLKKFFGKFATAGDRGFFALKTFRQELFDHYYDRLSNVEKADPEMAKEIAKIVNHATGTSKVPVPEAIGTAIFAPRLEASRWERLIIQPAKALLTFKNWKEATPAERAAAKIVTQRAATIVATYYAALAANQGLLAVSGSDKKINFFHPLESDWLKFKFGDKTADVTGGMVSSMRFLANLLYIPFSTKKDRKGESEADRAVINTGKYIRGKFSPFAGASFDAYTHHDYNGNTLPFSNEKPVHKYNHKLTWKEYLWTQAPIPAAEGAKEVYERMKEKGLSEPQIEDIFNGIFVGGLSGGTGARIAPDYEDEKR